MIFNLFTEFYFDLFERESDWIDFDDPGFLYVL